MCYFRLEYYDLCEEYTRQYLLKYPVNFTCLMLQACCSYKMFDGRKAEFQVKELEDKLSPYFKFNEAMIHLNKVSIYHFVWHDLFV